MTRKKMSERGLLIVLSGPSGVGKDTVLRRFLTGRDDCVLSVSATTRPPRPGEEEGKDYYFISRGEFDTLVRSGRMLEWAEYSGNCYGTPAEPVEQHLAQGRNVILEIEVQGALQIREARPDAVFVFLLPPSMEVLHSRLEGRGTEDAEMVRRRMEMARLEIASAHHYDYVLINHAVEETCKNLDAVLVAARHSNTRMLQHLREEFSDA